MGFFLARILLIICFFVCSYQFKRKFNKNPEIEWDNLAKMTRSAAAGPMSKVFRDGSPAQKANLGFLMLPDFLVASSANDQKTIFKPEIGARNLPQSVKRIMFPRTTTAAPDDSSSPKLVEVLCHIDRIYVRIRRDVFKTLDAYKYLKLGTCAVNQGTREHYYFLYYLTTDCDFRKQSNVDALTIKNVLHYLPTTAVLRDIPFDVPVECNYQRLLHSYKVGIQPKRQGGTLFKSLKRKSSIVLTAQDASGNELTGPYFMGEPMFFEASWRDGAAVSADSRMYINQCFIAAAQVPTLGPKYTVIDNFGCMVDGKQSADSRFLAFSSKLKQRFTISAVLLRGMASSSTQQLYMHCDIVLGNQPPSEALKACNYDPATRTWNELYGNPQVCACCDSTCSSAQQPRPFRNIVTSQPWKVDFKEVDEEDNIKMKSFDDFSFEDHAMEMSSDF